MDEFTMKVSGICIKDGRKCAHVSFADSDRYAEGIIPECRIVKNKGFTDEEIAGLEMYLKMNLGALKTRAAGINPVKALIDGDHKG